MLPLLSDLSSEAVDTERHGHFGETARRAT
jgi:hypothetical protein